jgi:hypothetical protein
MAFAANRKAEVRMFRSSCSLAFVVALGLAGCGGGGPRLLPGSLCKRSSECNDKLVCIYGECHEQCKEAKECPAGQLCAGPPGAGVCLLEEEETCGLNSHCEGELFCAIDLKCRTQCEEKKDCPTPTQECVPSLSDATINVCAEPEDAPNGMLSAPDAGATTDAGATSDAGADAAPSDSAADGTEGSDGGTAGDAGDAPSSVTESEPNESRDQPNPYTPGTTLTGSVGSQTDVDYYEVMVPVGDLAGGYYQASITEVGDGQVHAVVYTAPAYEMIHQATGSNTGADLSFYWAAAPGQKYWIALNRAGSFSNSFVYTLKILYTRVNDLFEPNDTSDTGVPKLVTLGVPVTGYFFAGFKARVVDPAAYEDWFELDLPAGMITITLANVASNWRPMVTFIDEMGIDFTPARAVAANAGATISKPNIMVTTPGRYRALIQGYANQSIDEAATEPTVPDNFTKPYTFTVSLQ